MGAAPKENLSFEVEITAGPHAGTKLSFSKASVSIGRGPENDIVLANDPRASRQHAEIKVRGQSEIVVINLSAKNFVLVNGQSVQSEILLKDSVIQIGESELRVLYDAPSLTPAVNSAGSEPFTPANVAHEPAKSFLTPLGSQPFGQGGQSPVPTSQPGAMKPSGGGFAPPPVTTGFGNMPPVQQPLGYGVPAPMGQPQYGGPMGGATPPPMGAGPSGPRSSGLLSNPRARFYGIIGILGIVVWFFMSGTKSEKKDENAIRNSMISLQDVADAEKRNQELLTIKKEKYDSVQYRRAQENFVKGFRDFQQGQYARAREAFQVVLNLDPDNELAKRYFHLSKIKFDELVKFNMIQGNRYREKRNWRMCQSNYSNVLTMLHNRKDDPTFKEAKQYYDECTLNLEGRF
ncbi:hypothetical protein BDW_01655 [Bdellovibrio bacteriovorus W]|nr:hypothetical protein BDW_01655 [Bdellovibrio bacteriovorus W]